jgi:hypothetical protein
MSRIRHYDIDISGFCEHSLFVRLSYFSPHGHRRRRASESVENVKANTVIA